MTLQKWLGDSAFHQTCILWAGATVATQPMNSASILAAKYPHLVGSLTIFGANAFITPEDIQLWELTRDVKASWSRGVLESLTQVYGDVETVQRLWDRFCDGMVKIHDKRHGDVCLQWLHRIKCPTLILHGDKDAMVSPVHPKYFRDQIAGKTTLYEHFLKENTTSM